MKPQPGDRIIVQLARTQKSYNEATRLMWDGRHGEVTDAYDDGAHVRLDLPRPDLVTSSNTVFNVSLLAGDFIPEEVTIEEHPF